MPGESRIVKIMIVHNRYQQPGGEDVVFAQECELLTRAGHEVVAYCRSNWEVKSYSGVKRLALARRAIWAEDRRRDFVELLRMQKPDLIHVHNTFIMISPSIYAACHEAGVPVVQTLHNYRLFCPAARQTWTRDITSYITLTEFARSKFVQGGLPPEKIFIKPNFVYPDPGSRDGCDDGDYVLFVGRLSPEKRVGTLLKAWALLRNRIPLLIIGGGPQHRQLEETSQEHGLGSRSHRLALYAREC